MKKYALFLILNVFLIFQYFSYTNAYNLFDPVPTIETDKLEYFLDEEISIRASWNIYSSPYEETHIKIFLISTDPEILTQSWVINNSLYEIDCPFENGYNLFQTFIQCSTLSLNSSQFPITIWVLLMIYNMEDEILINDNIFWNWTQITLKKYNSIFSTQIEDQINLEFKDDYIINNSIIAQQNNSKYYSDGIISASLKINTTLIDTKDYNISDNGSFSINIDDFNINFTGLYNLSLKILENDLFYGEDFFQIINISEKIIEITTLNKKNYIFNSSNDFFVIEIRLVDKNNITVVLNDPIWDIQTNFNQNDIFFMNNCYYIRFIYPQLSGKYFVNISVFKIGYEFNSLYYEFEFKEFPIADFFSSSNLIIAGQTVYFYYSGTVMNDRLLLHWDFGNEIGTANEINPDYTYNIQGFYTIILTIYDVDGDNIVVKKIDYIEVIEDCIPEANITFNSQSLIIGEEISFFYTGTSGNGLISFVWDFGDDNGISHERNPRYTYQTPGMFTIILIVIDLDGDNSTFIQNIRVLEHSDNIILNNKFKDRALMYSLFFSFVAVSIIIGYSRIKRKNISKKIPLKTLKL